ncbi:hypothetical protein JI743_03170 [Sphingopyxis sp. DHUNG17]|uniref:trypco2 family protein n=1 Tax=Sphingopyxis jiangsuensis TaxID=2871171 RepID=UPI00191C9222|nr:trypco2 family protein [Sphingopyxis lutea]MBL0767799.1 hypothetical protein [Sphingopyxis lutea]
MAETANSDELSAFVTSTLVAIAKGITDAQGTQIKSAHGTGISGFSAPKEVEFDIAVSAKKVGTAEGGFKVQVFSVGANLGASDSSESSSVSRIKFVVPSHFKSTQSEAADDGGSWRTV